MFPGGFDFFRGKKGVGILYQTSHRNIVTSKSCLYSMQVMYIYIYVYISSPNMSPIPAAKHLSQVISFSPSGHYVIIP